MIRTGIPALLLLIIALVLLIRAVNRNGLKSKNKVLKELSLGWTMSFIALALVSTTVHLWNVPFTFFFFFLGAAGWIADPTKVRAKAKAKSVAPKQPEALSNGAGWPGTPAFPVMPQPMPGYYPQTPAQQYGGAPLPNGAWAY